MGIRLRLENMMTKASASQAQLLEQSYIRLCDPKEMGEIYKILYIGHKKTGDVFPFLSEETALKDQKYG